MKHILQNITALSLTLCLSIGAVKAQTTILEQSGASNQFVVADWTTTEPFSIVNSNKVNILKDDTGTLTISNTAAYKNIKVEIHVFQDDALNITAKALGSWGGETKTIISDATGATNKAIFSFNNSYGLVLNQLKVSNSTMTMGIVYLKITGVLDATGSVNSDTKDAFDVRINKESLIINSEIEGTLNVYNSVGQVEGTYTLSKGENTVLNSTKGISFLVLTNSTTGVISRKKISR